MNDLNVLVTGFKDIGSDLCIKGIITGGRVEWDAAVAKGDPEENRVYCYVDQENRMEDTRLSPDQEQMIADVIAVIAWEKVGLLVKEVDFRYVHRVETTFVKFMTGIEIPF